jgi:hypothetical protein
MRERRKGCGSDSAQWILAVNMDGVGCICTIVRHLLTLIWVTLLETVICDVFDAHLKSRRR